MVIRDGNLHCYMKNNQSQKTISKCIFDLQTAYQSFTFVQYLKKKISIIKEPQGNKPLGAVKVST